MSLRKPHGLKTSRNDAGFTLIEVMVSLAIVTMIGLAIWSTFATGVKLISHIPETGETNISILMLEHAFRQQIGLVDFPLWATEFEASDDDSIELPYYMGFKDYQLFLYTEREDYADENYLIIEGNLDQMDQDLAENLGYDPFKLTFGPFARVEFEYVTDEDDFLIGIEVTVEPMMPAYGDVKIYGKIGGLPFWKED